MMRVAGRAAAALVLVLASQIAFIALLPNGFGGNDLNLLNPPYHAPEDPPIDENPLLVIHDGEGITSIPRGNSFSFAQNFHTGILNPANVEKVAHSSADILSARTDLPGEVLTNLEFDDARDWKASQAEVSVWNLTRLYAVNGTFDDGFPGINVDPDGAVPYHPYNWDATRTDIGFGQTQIASYYNTGRKYILVENRGYPNHPNFPKYEHHSGTEILWNQTINNSPAVTQFKLSFDFLYARGPLTKPEGDSLSGNCSVIAYVDGSEVWNSSLLVLESRDVWYPTGEILVTLPTAKSRFNLEIGLRIDDDLVLDPNDDYDNDGLFDSMLNTYYIAVQFDAVLFVGASPPEFDEVNLQFRAGGNAVPVTGATGEGAASVVNSSYWTVSPVAVELTSNTSVYFDYQASLLVHRFENSTWKTDIAEEGVSYSVELGGRSQLALYAFVTSIAGYDNFSLRISCPDDWANVTVHDPYGDPVTPQCSINVGLVEIPYSLVTVLGWWELTLEAPNYAKSITPQKFDAGWVNDTLYRSGNKTRALIGIGTEANTPSVLDLVNTSWYLPNGTLWSDDTVNGGVGGVITSSSYGLGALNTSAGEWEVEVLWTNGTEVAYGVTAFEVHHAAELIPVEDHIVTESGSIVTNFVRYRDAENGEYLMDPSATILANWSASTKVFHPNDIHLYWEPTDPFDTSLVGPGNSSVLVQASREFFDNASCIFIVEVTFTDNELVIYDLAVDVGLFDTYVCQFYYEDQYGNFLEGASVNVSVSGPGGGLVVNWSSFIDLGFGNYSISFTTQLSSTYQVTISAEADFYESAKATLLLYVGEISTGLEILNGTAGLVPYGENFSLVMRYTNSTDHGIEDADITIASVTPSGLNVSASIDEGNGFYSLVLVPLDADDFTILIRANITNYQTQIERFTLSVAPIPTDLHTASGNSSASAVFGAVYELEVQYATTPANVSIDSALIQIEFTSIEELNWTVVPSGDDYILRIEADELGRWELTITAQKALHQTGSIQFVLFVAENPTSLVVPVIPSSVYIGDISSYVFTYRLEGGVGVVDANVSFSGINPDWVSFTPMGYGNYSITIEAFHPGTFSFNVVFTKYGYQMVHQPIAFQVNRIPLTIEMAPPTWMVTSDLTFNLTLMDSTGNPVSDAFVNYTITQGGVDLHIGVMTEDPDLEGTYIATISQTRVPWTGNQLYSIKISVSKENYHTVNQGLLVNVYEYMPPGYEVQVFVQTVVPQIAAIMVALVSLVIGRRMYQKNRRKKALAILAVKRRFEDIRGILGIIVIHKTSGLGIYSKILKGGFDEGMMSAFITAITHFRTEFEMEELHWEFNVVPISDIISIVPTRNLLCAFIVGSRPTMTLEDRMVGFARSVGAMFDETMESPPRAIIDDATQGLFDYLFDDIMDGALLRQYRVKKDAPFPRSQKCLQIYLEAYPQEDGFGLDTLADGMAMCGIQEGNVYRQIIDAIENGILESIDPEENYPGFQKDADESPGSEPADL
ncbi:MAG: hypothetical protein ACTSPR_00640 [Candidatus Thorarchaeota archaeon]